MFKCPICSTVYPRWTDAARCEQAHADKPVYYPLAKAARMARMSERRLHWLCESDSLDCHGAQYGSTYMVVSYTAERLQDRRARWFGGVRHVD